VRNIQLEDWSIREGRSVAYRPAKIENPRDKQRDMSLLARDVLLLGRGDYVHRAWIFMLLARQENLNVVLLAVPDKDGPHGLRPWLPALVHNDGLYLFDTYLGLPIPGPNQRPATLEQVLADPAILEALDTPREPYPLARDELQGLVALVEGSPAYLTRRMMAVESRLAGAKKVVLFATPTLQAEKLKGVSGLAEVRLWTHPFEVLQDHRQATPDMLQTVRAARAPFMIRFPTPRMRGRGAAAQEEHPLFMKEEQGGQQAAAQAPLEQNWCSLWTGRMMHFKGTYLSDGAIDGANLQYLTMIIQDEEIDPLIDRLIREQRMHDDAMIQQFRAAMREFLPLAKQNATYWLGLIALDRGKHSTAVDYFERARDRERDGPWRYGATYNLARTYEEQAAQSHEPQAAKELLKQAIELLEQDDSAQALGNRLRARQLKAKL
jgi:tetratricopeptide (TPR) repeat protein